MKKTVTNFDQFSTKDLETVQFRVLSAFLQLVDLTYMHAFNFHEPFKTVFKMNSVGFKRCVSKFQSTAGQIGGTRAKRRNIDG